jgi:hypothetical protein
MFRVEKWYGYTEEEDWHCEPIGVRRTAKRILAL